MPVRARIAFAACPPRAEVVRRVAPRFAAVADVRVHVCPPGGVEHVVPAIREDEPHVVVADSTAAAYLADRLGTTVVPFEFTVDVLTARVSEARREEGPVGVVVMAGSVNPAVARLLERTVGRVPILFWNDETQRRDALARCRWMGLRAIVGGTSTAELATREGMVGFCLYDRPGETDGAISQMIFTAGALATPKVAGGRTERLAVGLILDRICTGLIGPHDAVFCIDSQGLVTAVFAGPRLEGDGPGRPEAIPEGAALHEVLGALVNRLPVRGEDRPVPVDLHPLPRADGCVVVVRSEPQSHDAPASGSPAS